MSESLLEVKKRIETVKSIKKITNAMKLIASSKSTRLKGIYEKNYSYTLALHDSMVLCLKNIDYTSNKLPSCLLKHEGNKKLYILITSALGLCGSYNYSIDKLAKSLLTKDDDVIFIGERGYKHHSKNINKSYIDYIHLLDNLTFQKANSFRHYIDNLYRLNQYSEIDIIYTKYINSITTKAMCEKLLPLREIDNAYSNLTEPVFEGGSSKVIDLIVPHYLDALIYRYFLESELSENISRRNSMDNASSSAETLINKLKLDYNKLRQQKITQEITEIVSGSN